MNAMRMKDVWRYWLALVVLCIWSMPQIAGAVAPVSQIPTGPKDVNGNWATPDYYTTANWANSPPMAKFVDTLPGLGAAKANNLGQYLPVAVADTTTYPGSDYYIIALRQYTKKLHSDLNPTTLRGYVQLDSAGNPVAPINYLGPIIVAERDRPVRLKFINQLPTGSGGDLFIPTDTTVMGSGTGPADAAGQPCDNTPLNNPNGCASYPQNRADIHLHGGRTPWISDGTPHQWITPAGEVTPFKQGVSMQNVPDMPAPGPGESTYYFTNQQSARLMFYHDHAFGITRLNVYAGEAAGYLITDKYEQDLVNRGLIPPAELMVPLVIQDKTFVDATPVTHPVTGQPTTQVRVSDPLWNWGSGSSINGIKTPVTGDLWLPHVYMPAQSSIAGAGGVNPFGRWMYGPWFYPATVVDVGPKANPYYDPDCSSPNPFILANCQTPGQPEQIPGTPNVSMGMEAFQDSVVVNGTAFPSVTVDPRTYRFRILNAANDRFQNLSFYIADSTAGNVSPDARLTAAGKSNLTEVKMVPASAALAAANNWPVDWPVDGRDGGVPDPGACQPGGMNCPNFGPSFLQIATEGGFLPKPVVINPQPITYITDPTAFWVGNVDKMGLALGPAERADVLVDFSAYAGKTLILYNDAPAAWPARVPVYDYYTGAPDLRANGGYGAGGVLDPATGAWVVDPANASNVPHGVLPGYAPNTRTVLQVIVRGTGSVVDGAPSFSFNQAALEAEFTSAAPATAINPAPTKTLFERSQEPIIVGQASYASAYPNSYFPLNFPWEGISQINDANIQFVTVAGEQVVARQEPKGIHDEMGASFDPVYGRMSGNLGMQIPNPTTLTANLILYGFADLATENINNSVSYNVQVVPGTTTLADGTQIWKISHNGVDTHPIHFHIFDVQLLNRVGWDGQILMPEPNELGWKDTVKISPLEDTIVAVRPRAPALPFGIPESIRPLNPAIPINSTMGFNSIDPATGQAYVAPSPYAGGVTNTLHNFGWEYVWHCHILSHEEMDMMRPIVLNYVAELPPAFTASLDANGVNWVDPTPITVISANPEDYRNAANEIGYNVYRTTTGSFQTDITGKPISLNSVMIPANSTTFADPGAASKGETYIVEAFNAKGSTFAYAGGAPTVTVAVDNAASTFTPAGPVVINATVAGVPTGVTVTQVALYDGANLIGSLTAAPYQFSWTGATAGSHSMTAKATLSFMGGMVISSPVNVTINSTISADFTPNNGASFSVCTPITFDSSASTGSISSYSWLINSVSYSTPTVTLSTLHAGNYPVTLGISALSGETAQVTKNITVTNNAPVANHGGPYTMLNGISVTLNGTGTDADACDVLSYAWDVDNKNGYEFLTANPTISYKSLMSVLGAGTHTINFKVTDSNGGVSIATTTLTVPPAGFTTTALPDGGVNVAYNFQLTAIGQTLPFTWSATGLPSGLSINPSTGVISGIPVPNTVPTGIFATFPVAISLTDSAATTINTSYSLKINQTAPAAPSGLTVTATSPTQAVLNWVDNANNENVVQVQRALNNTFTSGLTSVNVYGTTLTTYTDNTGVPGTTYYYRVRSGNTVAWSTTFSNIASVTLAQILPAAPSGLTATATSPTQVVLNWVDNANNENVVQVQRALNNTFTSGLTSVNVYGTTLTTYTDNTGVPGTTYYYRVRSGNSVGWSTTFSNIASVTLVQIAPAAPSGLTATATSPTQVVLNWVDNANNENVIQVQRALNNTFTSGLTSVNVYGTTLTTYTDNTVVPGTTYYYRVRSGNSVGWSTTFSNIASVTLVQIAPAAPSGLTATATSPTQVVLNWVDNANNENVIQVQRALNNSFTSGLTSVNVYGTTLTTYTDNTVVTGTTYFYQVKAGNSVAWSGNSNTVTVTP